MKIIKRSGSEDIFDISKIEAAIRKANDSVIDYEKLGDDKIQAILSNVEKACENMKRSPSVEEIQDMVENQIMSQKAFNVARNYITYRYKRELVRKSNSTDEQILSLLECNNEEVKQENSNKNPTVNSVQRDYIRSPVRSAPLFPGNPRFRAILTRSDRLPPAAGTPQDNPLCGLSGRSPHH